ncbi:MAG: hypothetical protein LUG98_00460 [Tannerellaceae bacterium]|nr:hypothetical protein [Tannerellaceae bacterium]
MSVRYRAVKRKVLGGEFKGQERVYAVARSAYVCDLERVCELVARTTKISDAEVVATIKAFLWVSRVELTNGATLRLGDFCSLRVVLRSEGVLTKEELSPVNIKGARVVFRAGPKLVQSIRDVRYELYTPEKEFVLVQPGPEGDEE